MIDSRCNFCEFNEYLNGRQLIIFGAGGNLGYLLDGLEEIFRRVNLKYIVDNNFGAYSDGREIYGVRYKVKSPDVLKEEYDECAILISSGKYEDDIYNQLCEMSLPDSILVFRLSDMFPITCGNSPPVIPKIIHCFWFSGDDKTEIYKACIETWKDVLPDYEIIEWNSKTYDFHKNRFMQQAFEARKWAFVSDFARLDVVNEYGGIYLDMDVRVIKKFDALLLTKGFFGYDSENYIDLGSGFGSVKNNDLLEKLMSLYANVEFTSPEKYIQPRFIKNVLQEYGLVRDGNYSEIRGNRFYPRNFFAPIDGQTRKMITDISNTYSVHMYNGGWIDDGKR